MVAIGKRFGAGGQNLQPGGSGGAPTLAMALRDIADDLAGIRPAALAAATVGAALAAPAAVTIGADLADPAAVTIGADLAAPAAATVGADIAAFTDPPTAGEMATLRTFVNALKADVGTLRGEVATAFTRVN
jgi:hypothetical protein